MLNSNETTRPIGGLHVAELAAQTGVTPATIRYYARTGLLNPGREPENGYRCFSGADKHRVRFVRQAQALGLTISDIKSVLATVDDGEVPCDQVQSLVETRLQSIREQITELHATKERIQHALIAWEDVGCTQPADGELCPLIERLAFDDTSLPEPSTLKPPRGRHGQARASC